MKEGRVQFRGETKFIPPRQDVPKESEAGPRQGEKQEEKKEGAGASQSQGGGQDKKKKKKKKSLPFWRKKKKSEEESRSDTTKTSRASERSPTPHPSARKVQLQK